MYIMYDSAELLDRFPLEDSKETRIENGISDFCFPNGLQFCRGIQMPKFFCFVLTNGEVSTTCQKRFEVWDHDRDQASDTPHCYCH